MKEKFLVLFEVIAIFAVLIFYLVRVAIPEYQESLGSSDSFISSNKYQNMIEVRIDGRCDFALVLDSKGNIYHLFFFDNASTILYNKNIENHNISDGLSIMVPILIENSVLTSSSFIEVFHVNEKFYSDFRSTWDNLLLKYSIDTSTLEKVISLEERALELGFDADSNSSILMNMDFYSKEFVKNTNYEVSKFDLESSKKFANQVYRKLEDYVSKKNITSLEKNHSEVSISLIPADSNMKYYPTTRSWYYVVDGRVYAFIEFQEKDKSYSYCYSGSIDSRVEGECVS